MLLQRIKTSPLIPKILFFATAGITIFNIALIYTFLTVDASTLINESTIILDDLNEGLSMSDSLTAVKNGG